MKRTMLAWGSKTRPWFYVHGHEIDTYLSTERGKRCEWYQWEWPPVRVKITIEPVGKKKPAKGKQKGKGTK